MGWVDDLIVKLSGGYFSIAGLLNVSQGSIVTEKDKFITSKGVTKVIQVSQMPYSYQKELITVIAEKVGKMDNSIVMNSYIEADRCSIPINHPTYISKATRALQQYVTADQLFSGLGKIHQRSGVFKHNGVKLNSFGKEDVLKAKNTADSYTEVRNNIKQNGGVYFLTRLFLHFTFVDHKSATTHYDAIHNFIESTVMKAAKVNKKMGTYLLNMSPSVTNIQQVSSPNILASELSLTNLIPYRSSGLVSTKGNLLGTDVLKKAPFYLDPFSTDEGSSMLVVGPAGSGKTVFGYHYGLQSMANHTTSIFLDLKGGTVAPALGELISSVEVINYTGRDSKFINPLILDSINKDYGVKEAVETTAAWLMLMVELRDSEGSELDLVNILKAAIRGYYAQMQVYDDNPSSYYKSKDMELAKLITFMGQNKHQTTDQDEIKLYSLASKRILSLLQEYGMDKNDNAIDITSLYDSDAIVFDFNKDKEVTVERIDVIRIFSVIFFTKQLSSYNKRNDRFTQLFADEINQYLGIKGLLNHISDLTARARSSNTSVIGLTNDLSVVSRPEMSGFMSNIAVYAVGSINDHDKKLLEGMNSSPLLMEQVKAISTQPGKYKHSFAIHSTLNGHQINRIVRADLPPHVAHAFRTRTIITEEY